MTDNGRCRYKVLTSVGDGENDDGNTNSDMESVEAVEGTSPLSLVDHGPAYS